MADDTPKMTVPDVRPKRKSSAKSITAADILLEQESPQKPALLLDRLQGAPKGPIVEVGCLRTNRLLPSDGWSTLFLAKAAADQERDFHSMDIDAAAVEVANTVLKDHGLKPQVTVDRAEIALAEWEGDPIAFLHLDGSDDPAETLAQYRVANLAKGAVVCVDDAQFMGPEAQHGKATALIPYLQETGVPFELRATEPHYSTLVAVLPRAKASEPPPEVAPDPEPPPAEEEAAGEEE